MKQEEVNLERMNRYCVVCGRESSPDLKKCCSQNSLVAIKKKGFFNRKIKYFSLNGRQLNEEEMSGIHERETAIHKQERGTLAKETNKSIDKSKVRLETFAALETFAVIPVI